MFEILYLDECIVMKLMYFNDVNKLNEGYDTCIDHYDSQYS